jgi:hypothetical protein
LEIAHGTKTVEVRKNKPSLPTPFKVYIYVPKKRPLLAWGDVFRGNWETEFTEITGRSFDEACRIWEIFNGNVMGEFVCDEIKRIDIPYPAYWHELDKSVIDSVLGGTCLSLAQIHDYLGHRGGYGWHITDLVIYDEPKKLSEFMKKPCDFAASCGACGHAKWLSGHRFDGCELQVTRPPQSWCYVEELP